MSKDYYKILQIEKDASSDEIKRAFRKLAHKYHPDKQGGDEQKFKEVNEAYQVLSDEGKRQQYDQFGTTFDQAGAGGFGGANPFGSGGFSSVNFDLNDLGDIFGDVFGFGTRKKSKARGADIEMNLEIDFKEAAFGTEKKVNLYKNVVCSKCSGNGAEPGTKIETCKNCQGSGKVTKVQQTILGAIQTRTACPDCQGEGQKAEKKCTNCAGIGIEKKEVEVNVKVPAGINNRETIKINNEGDAGLKGHNCGDLYISFNIKPDPVFERQDYDILTNEKISFTQAVLGDKIDIETIDGQVNLKIPSGTQSGTKFRLKGKGIPKLKAYGRGDHWITIDVDVPKNLSRKQKELLKKMDL